MRLSCLRSWFQRQQTCPTCRMDVLRASQPNTTPAPAAPAPPAAPAAPANAAAPPAANGKHQPSNIYKHESKPMFYAFSFNALCVFFPVAPGVMPQFPPGLFPFWAPFPAAVPPAAPPAGQAASSTPQTSAEATQTSGAGEGIIIWLLHFRRGIKQLPVRSTLVYLAYFSLKLNRCNSQ